MRLCRVGSLRFPASWNFPVVRSPGRRSRVLRWVPTRVVSIYDGLSRFWKIRRVRIGCELCLLGSLGLCRFRLGSRRYRGIERRRKGSRGNWKRNVLDFGCGLVGWLKRRKEREELRLLGRFLVTIGILGLRIR